jgi:hypothetical protein
MPPLFEKRGMSKFPFFARRYCVKNQAILK